MRKYAVEQLSGSLTRLAFEVRRASRHCRPDEVHDLRVSIRRFLACLSIFRDHFSSRVVKKCRRRLRRVLDLAADVRNRDVSIELVAEAGARPRSALFGWLTETRHSAKEELVEELRRLNRREFSRRWREALGLSGNEPKESSSVSLGAAVRYASGELPALAQEFFKRGRRAAAPSQLPEALHQFRLATKRFRYEVELFRPLYGPGLGVRLTVLRSVQGYLGEVNDCAAAGDLLRGAPAEMARSGAAAARRIAVLGERRARAFRLYWNKEVDSPKIEQNWMDYLTRYAGRKPAPRRS